MLFGYSTAQQFVVYWKPVTYVPPGIYFFFKYRSCELFYWLNTWYPTLQSAQYVCRFIHNYTQPPCVTRACVWRSAKDGEWWSSGRQEQSGIFFSWNWHMHGLWKHGVCVFCSFSTILAVYCCCCSYITYSTKNKNQYVRQLWVRLNEKLIVRTQLWKLRKISAVRIIFREIYSSILKRDRAWPMRVVEGLCRFMGLPLALHWQLRYLLLLLHCLLSTNQYDLYVSLSPHNTTIVTHYHWKHRRYVWYQLLITGIKYYYYGGPS